MRILLLLCLVAALSSGCKRQHPAAPAAAKAAQPPNPETDMANLTIAVRAYAMTQGKAPMSLEDLVAANCIPRLPEAPPGKRYQLDAKKTGVVLIDQ